MGNFKQRHPEGTVGALFTDLSCIDCGTCYHLGPALFHEHHDDKSIVVKQPENLDEWSEAKRAILSCPTNSIGVHEAPDFFKTIDAKLPLHIDENVHYLGFTARESFGATSYFIERTSGNIMIDSPRFHPTLVKELEKRGGVKWMILSHQDDVADHQKFHEHFGCERFIHVDDVNSDTEGCERILEGAGPFQLDSELRIITTPGHTKGHVCVNYRDKFLFTGDHLFVDLETERLTASKGVCWYDWDEQVRSVEKLLAEDFEWVMPGHGGWMKVGTIEGSKKLKSLIKKMASS